MDSIALNLTDEINQRQDSMLGDFGNNKAVVVGLGGIGSWVAIDLALIGVGTIFIYDDDVIEASNLNRTLFTLADIGKTKVEAVTRLIEERRPDVIVVGFKEKFRVEEADEEIYRGSFFFDCTDTTKLKDAIGNYYSKPPHYVKLGYDGFEATVSINDFKSGRWGEDNSYTVTPSFFGTPQMISALAVTGMLINYPITHTYSFNIKNIFAKIERVEQTEESIQNKIKKILTLEKELAKYDPKFAERYVLFKPNGRVCKYICDHISNGDMICITPPYADNGREGWPLHNASDIPEEIREKYRDGGNGWWAFDHEYSWCTEEGEVIEQNG